MLLLMAVSACRTDEQIVYMEDETLGKAVPTEVVGMYLLNEGSMGQNKCTLDYLDLQGDDDGNIHYLRNIYAERNPNEVKELGDVGNDCQIYGSQLWLVINCSNKVEACRVSDTRKLAQIDVPNCRYVAFHKGYAYVSSYVGEIGGAGEQPLGQVYKIDTLTHQVQGIVTVGYQPDELCVVGDRLYVANSGGYRAPDYDNRISIIDLQTFTLEGHQEVAVNLHRIRYDRYGQLWVTARGDYEGQHAKLLWMIPTQSGQLQQGGELDVCVSDLCILGDSLFFIGTQWSQTEQRNTLTSGIVNVRSHQLVRQPLNDTEELARMKMPYGIIVHPTERDYYVMDAKNYVSSGELLHFRQDGTFDYKVRTGDIPAHAAFVMKPKKQ